MDITHKSQGHVKLVLKYGKDRAKLGQKTHEASSKNMSSLLLTPLSVAVVTFAFGEKVMQPSGSRQSNKHGFLASGTGKKRRKAVLGLLHPTCCFHRESVLCLYLVSALLMLKASTSTKKVAKAF